MYPSSQIDHRCHGQASPEGSEPMALGSPVSSPTKNFHSGGMSFLPSYLIGDTPSSISPLKMPSVGWNTPSGKYSEVPYATQVSPVVPKNLYQSPVSSTAASTPNINKPGGPPVQSLFDSVSSPVPHTSLHMKIDSTPKTPLSIQNDSQQLERILTPSHKNSFMYNSSSYMSPAQLDPFYTQGEALTSDSQLDETWVTVFGFPPAATSFILQQFSQYGKITEQKLTTSGNWIHIKYQSKLQAKKALSKNGKVYGSNIMVGVKPCIEVELMNSSGKENTDVETSANFCQDSLEADSINSSKRSLKNMRPLTQIYKAANDTEVATQSSSQQPSLVSKAIGYLISR